MTFKTVSDPRFIWLFASLLSDLTKGRVTEALRRTLSDAKGAWLFDPQHREAKSEYALTLIEYGKPVTSIIDRSFVGSEGIRWIIDYKASSHEGGGLDAFLDREQERYRGQLERYAVVLDKLDSRPVRWGNNFRCWMGDGSGDIVTFLNDECPVVLNTKMD